VQCAALSTAIVTKLAGLMPKVNAKLCTCAGCCDPPADKPADTCFFPITTVIREPAAAQSGGNAKK